MAEPKPIVRLSIALDDTEPPVWRKVEVDASTTLAQLHHVIQAAMGWEDDHLHAFEIRRASASGGLRLADLAAQRVKRIDYLYDFGDGWQHTLRLEKLVAAEPGAAYPRLVDGAGRCPPEDCGGVWGFYAKLEALADPDHPDHDDVTDWMGGPFDPADMDRAEIDERLAWLAGRRGRKAG